MEIAVLGLFAVVAWAVLTERGRRFHASSLALAATLAASIIGASTLRTPTQDVQLRAAIPSDRRDLGYVSSDTCRSCHPDQYASWHKSYHRTMTQSASTASVLGDFDGVSMTSWGRTYNLQRRGDEFWAQMPDPDRDFEIQNKIRRADPREQLEPVWKRVVLTTGSHHMQTYWVGGEDGKAFRNLPMLWLNEERRWIPRESGFIRHVDAGRMVPEWNSECIKCHSTAPKPGFDIKTQQVHSAVGELGIACEACHGPAEAHVAANESPVRRYQMHWTADARDPTITNPAKLSAAESSQVCGQCHGIYRPLNPVDFSTNGSRYRPGGDVNQGREYLRHPASVQRTGKAVTGPIDESILKKYFWPDGAVRVTGREYTGMTESGCYLRGALSCLSCHSLHQSDPNDQLAAHMESDQACLQCHESYRANIPQHTHHAVGSSGSSCYNCHMPHTTYGLFTAVRNHLIDSPSTRNLAEKGRPNACNLCHLDQTLGWTADRLVEWYEQPPAATFTEEQKEISAAVLWLLRGDAGQRAIVAWSMRWEPARETSGEHWFAPYLANLLLDPYPAVRFIAAKTLRTLPGAPSVDADFLDEFAVRENARDRIMQSWSTGAMGDPESAFSTVGGATGRRGAELSPDGRVTRPTSTILFEPGRGLRLDVLQRLSQQRDDTLQYLSE